MLLPVLALLLAPAVGAPSACPLGAGWATQPSPVRSRNVLGMVDGPLTWNGALVSNTLLRQYLRAAASLSPRPVLVLDTTAMRCADRRRIAAEVEAAAPCTPDLCRAYDAARQPPPPPPIFRTPRRH